MKVILPKYSTNYNLIPLKTQEQAEEYGITFIDDNKSFLDSYKVHWGNKPYDIYCGERYGVMETGFFHEASFIDTVGNYQGISLNTVSGFNTVAEFELNGKKSAKDIIFGLKGNRQSKYNPLFNEVDIDEWTGPILILQNPKDRSILSVTSRESYLKFVNDACKFYGDKLFVKFHPWNSGEFYTQMEDIVKPHGCKYGKAPMKIIEKAEFCFSFNSTFAVDALLRDVPYVQYAMGTFFNAYGVIWSKGTFPTSVKKFEDGQRLCDFLIHKFCFNKSMTPEKFSKMLFHYASSKEMFPMIDKFSYANNLPK